MFSYPYPYLSLHRHRLLRPPKHSAGATHFRPTHTLAHAHAVRIASHIAHLSLPTSEIRLRDAPYTRCASSSTRGSQVAPTRSMPPKPHLSRFDASWVPSEWGFLRSWTHSVHESPHRVRYDHTESPGYANSAPRRRPLTFTSLEAQTRRVSSDSLPCTCHQSPEEHSALTGRQITYVIASHLCLLSHTRPANSQIRSRRSWSG